MGKGKFGVQMMMLKGKVEELGAYETMRKIRDLGYQSVEVSQIPMTSENVAELKRASEDFSIEIAACSAALEPNMPGMPGETLATDFEKIVNDCKTLNCHFLRIGMLPLHLMGNKEKIMEFIQKAEAMAEKLAEHGIELYYHNHHIEFEKYDGETLLDIMKNNTSKIGFELDVHWIHRGGENPIDVINRFENRISLIHLKDYRIGHLDVTEEDVKVRSTFWAKFTNVVEFAEVGQGSLDFTAIIEAGLKSGAKYFLVEQDDTYGRDPFDCLQTSAEHLRSLGYSDWF